MDDFRAWNVDQYDEDALTLAELEPQDARSEHDLLQLAQAKQSRARAALASGDTPGALAEALADPPYGAHATEARKLCLALVLDILTSTRAADIAPAVKALSLAERDTLMKYIYRGMELGRTPGEASMVNCAVLLSWHEKVGRRASLTQLTHVAGTGCIVRVMSDRRIL